MLIDEVESCYCCKLGWLLSASGFYGYGFTMMGVCFENIAGTELAIELEHHTDFNTKVYPTPLVLFPLSH